MATTTTEGARTSGVILKAVVVYGNGTFPLDIAMVHNMEPHLVFFKATER